MKKTDKLKATVLLGSAIIASGSATAQTDSSGNKDKLQQKQEDSKDKTFPILKKDSLELEQSLLKLAQTEYKGEMKMGAMCYMVGLTPPSCSICGHEYCQSDRRIKNIVHTLRVIGYDVVLECKHKKESQNYYSTDLIFKIRFSPQDEYHSIIDNNYDHYSCLLAFFQGKQVYETSNEGTEPLHTNIDVIRKMTGLGKDIITHNHYQYWKRNGKFVWLNKEDFIKALKKDGKTDKEIQEKIKWYDEK